MKVNLIGLEDTNEECLENVFQLLKSSQGPLDFHSGLITVSMLEAKESPALSSRSRLADDKTEIQYNLGPDIPETIHPEAEIEPEPSGWFSKSFKHLIGTKRKEWQDEDEFSEADDKGLIDTPPSDEHKKVHPSASELASWDTFFNFCRIYRRANDIGDDEHVVFLTEFGNDKNWFAGSDADGRNHFVHTEDWEFYFGEIDYRFPVAYEVAITILHKLVSEQDKVDLMSLVHLKPKGCVSDFCKDKRDIMLKMRTADICSSCIEHLQESNISRPLVQQVLNILDKIRDSMTFRSRSSFFNKPSRLELRGDMCKIYLTDLGDLEVRLTPRQRALYVFFLKHPEGIPLSHLSDHREEIEGLYARFASLGENEAIETALDNLFEPFLGTINTELSRIRAAFRKSVGEEMAKHYTIDGATGNPKTILLNRTLVA